MHLLRDDFGEHILTVKKSENFYNIKYRMRIKSK